MIHLREREVVMPPVLKDERVDELYVQFCPFSTVILVHGILENDSMRGLIDMDAKMVNTVKFLLDLNKQTLA